jgi:hypothetical protein
MKLFTSSRVFFIAFLFLIFPGNTFATSGACSYHGGVNCSYGSTYYGNVMCNDGWINSSVSFYDAEECQADQNVFHVVRL